jgi:hypothetical protein
MEIFGLWKTRTAACSSMPGPSFESGAGGADKGTGPGGGGTRFVIGWSLVSRVNAATPAVRPRRGVLVGPLDGLGAVESLP